MKERKQMIRFFLILSFVCLLSGCGTFGTVFIEDNKECKSLIYSGTRFMAGGNAHSLFFIDIPFSFVADTILLPYTISATLLCEPNSQELKRSENNVRTN